MDNSTVEEEDALDAFMAGIEKQLRDEANKAASSDKGSVVEKYDKFQDDDDITADQALYENLAKRRQQLVDYEVKFTKGKPLLVNFSDKNAKYDVVGDEDTEEQNPADNYNSDDEVYATAKAIALEEKQRNGLKKQTSSDTFVFPRIDHSNVTYPFFHRNIFVEHPDIANLSLEDVSNLRRNLQLSATGLNVPRPVGSFIHLTETVHKSVLGTITRSAQIAVPTSIQCQCIPSLLCGKDVIGIAMTGSGKTLGFLIPLVQHILINYIHNPSNSNLDYVNGYKKLESLLQKNGKPKSRSSISPHGLILCPTRELSFQIHKELKQLTKHVPTFRSIILAGGMNKTDHFKDLLKHPHVVIANPGRLIDIGKMKGVTICEVSILVLDEADRMLQMGFEAQVRSIVEAIRPDRQVAMFSATMPPNIESLARDITVSPVRIAVGNVGQAAMEVEQRFVIFDSEEKKWPWIEANIGRLMQQDGQMLVFCNSQTRAVELCALFNGLSYDRFMCDDGPKGASKKLEEVHQKPCCNCLHGHMEMHERMEALDAFRKGSKNVRILTATDIAARGLDIPIVNTVLNFDGTRDIDIHCHRIGRTGRAGRHGVAYTFLLKPSDCKIAAIITNHMKSVCNKEPPKCLFDLAMTFGPYRASCLEGVTFELKSKRSGSDGQSKHFSTENSLEMPKKKSRWGLSVAGNSERTILNNGGLVGTDEFVNPTDDLSSSEDENRNEGSDKLPTVTEKSSLLNLEKRRLQHDRWLAEMGRGCRMP